MTTNGDNHLAVKESRPQEGKPSADLSEAGAALSNPAEARLATGGSPASLDAAAKAKDSAYSYLPECDIKGFFSTPGRFESIDKDGDKFLSAKEIAEAGNSKNYTETEKRTLRYMGRALDEIEEASNDEWFDENSGITKADISKFEPFKPSLDKRLSDPVDKKEFHTYAETLADKLGIKDSEGQELGNAFRHALTSAVYAFKYGESTAFGLGELNEWQRKARDFFTEKGDHWWKDSKADSFNNLQGIAIANQLMENAKKSGVPVTVEDVVRATHEALKAGKLITNVDSGANQNGKILQKP